MENSEGPKFIITRRTPVPGQWEVDSATLNQWKNEKRFFPEDEIYNSATQMNSYAKYLYPELFKTKKSFSPLLIVVIVLVVSLPILGSIAALVVVNVLNYQDESRVETTKIQIKNIEGALNQYKQRHGSYPTTEQGLSALVTKPTKDPIPDNYPEDGYLKALPKDAWGHDFIFYSPGASGHEIEIISYGSDGLEGGEKYDADITNFGESNGAKEK